MKSMNDSDVTREANNAARTMRSNRGRGELQFQELLRRFPNDGMVYLQRAQAFEALGDLDSSAADYERAAGLLKYPSWIQRARDGAARVRQRPGSAKSAAISGRHPSVSVEEFVRAAHEFRAREPRAVVYDAAQVLLAAAIADSEHLSPAVAVAALIQSWNFAYYKNVACDAAHVVDLEFALHSIWRKCLAFRERDIASFARVSDGPEVRQVFNVLERVLGRVGAPKAMHLIAPNFFPLWDTWIAPAYGFELKAVGQNCETYLAFMEVVQRQAAEVRALLPARPDVLKAIDEYNYCRYSKRWI
ncbi:MAG TPA: hypothetical protein VGD94_18820 [Vicinamibacterales bacterium]